MGNIKEKDMPKKIKKKKPMKIRMKYSQESVKVALEEVKNGKPIASVSRKYSIPESTLRSKKYNKYSNKRPGPATILNEEEEDEIINWILHYKKKGFPITKAQLLESVQVICQNLQKRNPFKNNKPGRSWYESFLKRHPEISSSISVNVSLDEAKETEESLHNWFRQLFEYLSSKDLVNVEPERIFNCDETGVVLNPNSSLSAPKDCRNINNIVGNNEKEKISVLITGNAGGKLAPSFILFSGTSLPKYYEEMAPGELAFGCSESGRITSETFYYYIINVFEPWLETKQIKRPVILFIDAHKLHLTLHLSKFCSENQIVLIAFDSNAIHNLQPLKVFFNTLKEEWITMNTIIDASTSSLEIQKYQFASLFKKALDTIDSKQLLVSGFKECGLHLFDVNDVDFTKEFNRVEDSVIIESSVTDSEDKKKNTEYFRVIESLLTEKQLREFRLNEGDVWKGLTKDQSLFEIWYKLKSSI